MKNALHLELQISQITQNRHYYQLRLNEEEKAKFAASAAAVRKTNAALHEVGAL